LDEVQSSEVDALPAPFSLAQNGLGLFTIVRFPHLMKLKYVKLNHIKLGPVTSNKILK
jgi:hypothetical protein